MTAAAPGSGGPAAAGRSAAPRGARRSRRALHGARGDVHVLLRAAGGQAVAVGERHPGLPLPRRTGSRFLAAGRRRRPHRPARPADRPAGSARWPASRCRWWRWCTTSGSRAGSSTCCAWPSRRRRCRSARGSSPPTAPLAGAGGDGRAGRPRRGTAGAVAPAGPAARGVGPPGRPGRRPRGAGGGVVHRGAAVRHGHAVVARGATASCRSSSSARRPLPPAASA